MFIACKSTTNAEASDDQRGNCSGAARHDPGRRETPPDEQVRGLFEAGVIDEQGRVFSERLRMVEDLLHAKGFGGISAFHLGGVPAGHVRLLEKIREGRQAEGPYDKVREMIAAASDQQALWAPLDTAGYPTSPPEWGKDGADKQAG
jgi:hypothetical protein